jgi:GNAT superfamily N-acetyltransferase
VFGTRREVANASSGTMLASPASASTWRRGAGAVGFAGRACTRTPSAVRVGTLPEHRRQGIGTTVTSFAVHDAPDVDLAWLQPTGMGRPLYASMGFEAVGEWQVWVRPGPRPSASFEREGL